MKKPFLLFSLKCAVILYFAACTSIEDYTVTQSATPVITRGAWKVDLFSAGNSNQTIVFEGYHFTFTTAGDLKAVNNGTEVAGNWVEDHFSKSININLVTSDPILEKLNDLWKINAISTGQVELRNSSEARLNITSL